MKVEDAYREGRVGFMGVELLVAPGALVPREETELLGQTVVGLLRALDVPEPRVIDMCCGAGNLACAIARHVPAARVWASDLTDGCVDLARRNVVHTGVAGRVSVHQGDLFAPLVDLGLEDSIDVVVCNPPYISEKRLSGPSADLLLHEPREAFAAGPYGLSIHQRVAQEARTFLKRTGTLAFEFGLGQHQQIAIVFQRARHYADCRLVANVAGEPRVALAQVRQ